MVRWLKWHCPPDTGFEIRTLAVWGRARYLSVTEAPHNTDFHTWMGKKHFCFFQTAGTGNRTPSSGVKGSGANHYPRPPLASFSMDGVGVLIPYHKRNIKNNQVTLLRTNIVYNLQHTIDRAVAHNIIMALRITIICNAPLLPRIRTIPLFYAVNDVLLVRQYQPPSRA